MPCKMGTCLALISPRQRADQGGGDGSSHPGGGGGTIDSLHRFQSPLTAMGDICHLHRDSICRGDVKEQQQQHSRAVSLGKGQLRSNQLMATVAPSPDCEGEGDSSTGNGMGDGSSSGTCYGMGENGGSGTSYGMGEDSGSGTSYGMELARFEVKSFQVFNSTESVATSNSSIDNDESSQPDSHRAPPLKLELTRELLQTDTNQSDGKSRFKALLEEYNLVDRNCTTSELLPVTSELLPVQRHKRSESSASYCLPNTRHSKRHSSKPGSPSDSSGTFSRRRRSLDNQSTNHQTGSKTRNRTADLRDLVNTSYKDGRTLLHNAAHKGDVKSATWLIQSGAKVNARDHARRTPLHEVADRGHIPMARLLLEKGAKVNARDKWKCTPLHQAVAWKQARMVRLLLLQHDARATGGTLLQDAINMDPKEDVIVRMIQRGAEVNATDMTGQTPMHMAVKRGRASIVRLLLEAGANINKISRGMMEGNYHVVLNNARRQLATLGLEGHLQDGWSPLRVAQKYKHFNLVVWLVNCGANIVLCDGTGRFPHHKATMQRNCPSLHHIVAHPNCPLDIRDIDDNAPLKLSFEAHAKSMVDANPQCGCCRNQPGTTPAPSCDEYANTTILLLQHGADTTDLYILGYDLLYHLSSSKFSYDLRLLKAVLNSGNDLEELLSSAPSCLNALERQRRLDMYQYLVYFVASPRSLRDNCRLQIRSHLRRCRRGRSIWTSVTSLPLPHAVMDFLLLQDLQGATLTRHFTETKGCPSSRLCSDIMLDSDTSLNHNHSFC